MKIYTKKGDNGSSRTLTGQARKKNHAIFHVLGTLDELSAHVGLAIAHFNHSPIDAEDGRRTVDAEIIPLSLKEVQHTLFKINTMIAAMKVEEGTLVVPEKYDFDASVATARLEREIDRVTEVLPPLKKFILPGHWGLTSAQLHVARTVCRRAERQLVDYFYDAFRVISHPVLAYVNRLSDHLFTLARFAYFLVDREPQPLDFDDEIYA